MGPLHSSAPSPASPSLTGISPPRWKDRVQWVILCVTTLLPSDLSPALRAIHVVAIRCSLVTLNSSRYGFAFLELIECSFQEHSLQVLPLRLRSPSRMIPPVIGPRCTPSTTCLECFSDCSKFHLSICSAHHRAPYQELLLFPSPGCSQGM
ncbi:hypothetical protein B0H16DRAFT_1560964 [Mycena metata]|uniref:Uncharacterized protein n=1 Tax=Mycena metata TaxID=1033252 RepID=A0AAD7M6N1_9AGAR|nr:hypothetical protein B0H16DRAFT_1638295 [Mycena metata]KAJ7743559.1 hypothetical protein B0H16DRAFT_1560964 [Mycena metata]